MKKKNRKGKDFCPTAPGIIMANMLVYFFLLCFVFLSLICILSVLAVF